MTTKTIHFIDEHRNIVAKAKVSKEHDHFAGIADLAFMPPALRKKFAEYEAIVNGQMFGFLDDIEEEINQTALKVVFEEGPEIVIEDLQIYPSTGRVSFKLKREAAHSP